MSESTTAAPQLRVEYVRPEDLRPAEYNPRTISKESLAALARLLDTHGFVDPIIARREDALVVGGHQRLKANALRAKPDALVPCVFLEGLDDLRAKALNVALNNPRAQGSFDDAMLSDLIAELSQTEIDLPDATGFSQGELDELTRMGQPPEPSLDAAAGEDPESNTATLIFEVPMEAYPRVKPRFDELIREFGLDCHVRLGSGA